jgi:hypothetical protein
MAMSLGEAWFLRDIFHIATAAGAEYGCPKAGSKRNKPEEARIKRLTLGEIESGWRSWSVAMGHSDKTDVQVRFCTVRPATDVQKA